MWTAAHVVLKLGLLQCSLGLPTSFAGKNESKQLRLHAYVHAITFYRAPIMCQADNVLDTQDKRDNDLCPEEKENTFLTLKH